MADCNGQCRSNSEHLERHADGLGCMGDQFVKHDQGKPDYSLIPTEALNDLAEQLTMGAKKYKPDNWKKGSFERYYSAIMRHLHSVRMGEYHDEDGVPHTAAILANAVFIHHLELERFNQTMVNLNLRPKNDFVPFQNGNETPFSEKEG